MRLACEPELLFINNWNEDDDNNNINNIDDDDDEDNELIQLIIIIWFSDIVTVSDLNKI